MRAAKNSVVALLVLCLGACVHASKNGGNNKVCNVVDYGAKADGSNSTDAFVKAMIDCESAHTKTILVPAPAAMSMNGGNSSGFFYTEPLLFSGSSWDNTALIINFNVSTQNDPDKWLANAKALFQIENTLNFTLSGAGVISGRGHAWWVRRRIHPEDFAPVLVSMTNVTGVAASSLAMQDSPFHTFVLYKCSHIEIDHLNITAPKDSPNTDGIDLDACTHAVVKSCYINNGDDNVAIGSGSSDILIEDNDCINGHGISIGSINVGSASDIVFRNNRVSHTQNVARIKTWQGGHGTVSNISFINITVTETSNTILIDQYYCPKSQHPTPCHNSSSNVNITDITFQGITGTYADRYAGSLLCADSGPCRNISLIDIDLKPSSSLSTTDSAEALSHSAMAPVSSMTQSEPHSAWKCWQAFGIQKNVSPPACVQAAGQPRE